MMSATHYVKYQQQQRRDTGIILILSIALLAGLMLLLSACSRSYIVDNSVNVASVGPQISSKHFIFESCGLQLDEYQGAVSVSLYKCDSRARLVINQQGRDKPVELTGNDAYIFQKNRQVSFDLFPDGTHIHISNQQIWPDVLSNTKFAS